MTAWTPSDALVEQVARAISSADWRGEASDGPLDQFLERDVANKCGWNTQRARAVLSALPMGEVIEVLEEILLSGIEHETRKYAVMQVDHDNIDRAERILARLKGEAK